MISVAVEGLRITPNIVIGVLLVMAGNVVILQRSGEASAGGSQDWNRRSLKPAPSRSR